MQQFFATAGYRMEFAQHGGDALTLVQHDPPDLVLLDLMMPGMNGVEVLQRILALRATLPVIIVTARADATLAEQTRALGGIRVRHQTVRVRLPRADCPSGPHAKRRGRGRRSSLGIFPRTFREFLYCRVRAAPPAYRRGVGKGALLGR